MAPTLAEKMDFHDWIEEQRAIKPECVGKSPYVKGCEPFSIEAIERYIAIGYGPVRIERNPVTQRWECWSLPA